MLAVIWPSIFFAFLWDGEELFSLCFWTGAEGGGGRGLPTG